MMNLTRESLSVKTLFLLISIAASGPVMAGISGTKHDFTAAGGFPIAGVTELCASCHVPPRKECPLVESCLKQRDLRSLQPESGLQTLGKRL